MPLAKEGVISDHLKRDAFISNKGIKGNRSDGKWKNPPTLPLRTRVSFKHLLTQRVSNLLSTLSSAQIAIFLPLSPLPPQSTLLTYSQSSLIQAGREISNPESCVKHWLCTGLDILIIDYITFYWMTVTKKLKSYSSFHLWKWVQRNKCQRAVIQMKLL